MIPGLCSAFYKGGATGGLTASAAPSNVSTTSPHGGTLTSSALVCTPMGGTAPYTYLWSRASGDVSIHITSSTSASTTTSVTLSGGDTTSAQFSCQVTDAHSLVTNSNLVTSYFQTG